MASDKKFQSADIRRRYAWSQYFRLWDIHVDMCRQLQMSKDMLVNDNGSIPTHVKEWLVDLSRKANEFFECSICLEEIGKEKISMITKCGHLFHTECINAVEKNECPECRQKIR